MDHVEVWLDSAIAPGSFTTEDVTLTTSNGPLPHEQITVTCFAERFFEVSFPTQSAPGPYTVQIGPHISNFVGTEMDQHTNGVPGEGACDAYRMAFRQRCHLLAAKLGEPDELDQLRRAVPGHGRLDVLHNQSEQWIKVVLPNPGRKMIRMAKASASSAGPPGREPARMAHRPPPPARGDEIECHTVTYPVDGRRCTGFEGFDKLVSGR